MTNEAFINLIGMEAKADWEKRRICLPSVVTAQAILESGWGKSELATNANALFGIKKNGWNGATYIKDAVEQNSNGSYVTIPKVEWRAYESWMDSIEDHNTYLAERTLSNGTLRYGKIIGNTSYTDVCRLLMECGYATSLTYPDKLIALIEKYNLTKYDVTKEDKMKIVVIDAGHGMGTAGKRCLKSLDPNETREWWLNDRIADKVERMLADYDVKVVRADDTTGVKDIPLATRVATANNINADLYISIHHNAGLNGRSGGGTVVYYCSSKTERQRQCQALYDSVVGRTSLEGNRASRVINKAFYVIKNTKMPAFLIENGFMDSPDDVPVILTESHALKSAYGIVDFIVSNLSLESKQAVQKDSTALQTDAKESIYYPAYTGKKTTLVSAMTSLGITSTYAFRKKIASANNIAGYIGTASQNNQIYNLLTKGILRKV